MIYESTMSQLTGFGAGSEHIHVYRIHMYTSNVAHYRLHEANVALM